MNNREHYIAMDRADPLARFHAQFSLPENIIYLDGNSLGARPVAALERARQVVAEEWGQGLIGSWNEAGWRGLPDKLGDKLAWLIGANKGEVVVTDTTSINLFKVLAAALAVQADRDPSRKVIVTERSNFPTDIYIAQGLAGLLDDGYQLRLIDSPEQLPTTIQTDTAVVMITQVNYKTGYLHDMQEVTALAHECGALTVWDLCHSAGAVPIDLNAANADYAVGCTYKYLNGGPGSPAFVWASAALQDAVSQPLSGWWGHARQFQMEPSYEAAQGINRFLCGTQPITSMALIECGLDIFAQTDMQALRSKSLALTDLFIQLVQERCAGYPLTLVTPLDHGHRGSHVSFEHPQGYAVMQALIEKGVVGDYREPRIMRFGFTPLYTRYVDVWDAVEVLYSVLATESWNDQKYKTRKKVT